MLRLCQDYGGTGDTGTRAGIEQSVQVLLGAVAADARFRDQPNGVAQVPFPKIMAGRGKFSSRKNFIPRLYFGGFHRC
jgi:hypothetical protein